ncbi:MAG TPA: amidase family protein [Devosia sp.]|jgi:amidase|uniref:amidase family protein n=1 Tax=Devosia sp. TaxID=1871048 RepID=UPI002DDD37B7|nr:amidase family protein [Devosia sp.]HEV2514206.1 amidase family protein [Devosia sp.]
MDRLCSLGAVELAGLIGSGAVRSIDVVDAHLARIAAVNPTVNAITSTLADTAREAAELVDRAVAAGEQLGPLAGVPFTVKGNIDVQGSATTWGVSVMAEQIAARDAPLVARMRWAGAIPLARSNLPDFAFRWDTDSGLAGRTLNPWDPERTPGGSSGGEAVALATGMSPLGFGNDLGGSLRIPSQFCGTTAIRPTRGRVADATVTVPEPSLFSQMANCQGPMARCVADLRLALSLISARDARDPRWVPAPLASQTPIGRVKVAVVRNPLGGGVAPQVAAGVDLAAAALADAGYELIAQEPPQIGETMQAWVDAMWAEVALRWPQMQPIVAPGAEGFVEALLANGLMMPVDQKKQLDTWMAIHQLGAAWAQFFDEFPIVLSPVCCEPPWHAGDDIARVKEIRHAMRLGVGGEHPGPAVLRRSGRRGRRAAPGGATDRRPVQRVPVAGRGPGDRRPGPSADTH